LIEVLIDENEMGLEVSEIEGDAVHAANKNIAASRPGL